MKKAKIYYTSLPDEMLKEEKLTWFRENPLEKIAFERITPDEKGNWINLADNSEWDTLLAVCDKDVKNSTLENAIFKSFSNGIVTARDEWSYDFDNNNLKNKVIFFCNFYKSEQIRWEQSDKKETINNFIYRTIKFGSEIENYLIKGSQLSFCESNIIISQFRPFVKKLFYFDKIYTHRIYQHENIFGFKGIYKNIAISFLSVSSSHQIASLATNNIFDGGFLKQGNGMTQCLPLSTYDKNGNRQENITDWALGEFRRHYADASITKEAIFYYVYAVLHTPQYRAKYEQNLKRDFPRIPYYADFQYFSERGKALADLHIGYESATPYPLELVEKTSPKKDYLPKPKLKANKENGEIELDELTLLRGIPSAAWAYKLGNRTALEWILDQYKESKPSDKTIAEHFNTYQFSDYKATVIDLLRRVCRVSVETVRIVGELDIKV
jgi:predicted helicase